MFRFFLSRKAQVNRLPFALDHRFRFFVVEVICTKIGYLSANRRRRLLYSALMNNNAPFFDEVGYEKAESKLMSRLPLKVFELLPDEEFGTEGKAILATGIVGDSEREWFNSNWSFYYELIHREGQEFASIHLPSATIDGVGVDGVLSQDSVEITLHDPHAKGDFSIAGKLACGLALFMVLKDELGSYEIETFLSQAQPRRFGGVDIMWFLREFFEREGDLAEQWDFEAGGWKWGAPEECEVYVAEHITSGKNLGVMIYEDDGNTICLQIFENDWNRCVFG